MDAVIVLLIIGIVVFGVKRSFPGFVYAVGASEILFRLLYFLRERIFSGEVSSFLGKYFPSSIPSVIEHYTDGLLYEILIWIFVGIMIIFEFYTIRTFFKKRQY